jgi:hypothetical protein
MQQTQIHLSAYHDRAGIAAPAHAFSDIRARDWTSERFRTSHDSSNDLHRAEFDDAWLARTLATFNDKDRKEQAKIAKAYRTFLEENHSPNEAAQLYFANFANFPHDKFKPSRRQDKIKAEKALEPGKWGYRLVSQVPELYFYSLSMDNLGLPASYADPRFIYYSVVTEDIKAALKKLIPEPFRWKIEVGKAGNVHTHAAGPFSHLLNHLEGSKRMQAIKPGTEVSTLAYTFKPVAPWTQSNYATYLQAKAENQTRNLPKLSGSYGLGYGRTA